MRSGIACCRLPGTQEGWCQNVTHLVTLSHLPLLPCSVRVYAVTSLGHLQHVIESKFLILQCPCHSVQIGAVLCCCLVLSAKCPSVPCSFLVLPLLYLSPSPTALLHPSCVCVHCLAFQVPLKKSASSFIAPKALSPQRPCWNFELWGRMASLSSSFLICSRDWFLVGRVQWVYPDTSLCCCYLLYFVIFLIHETKNSDKNHLRKACLFWLIVQRAQSIMVGRLGSRSVGWLATSCPQPV